MGFGFCPTRPLGWVHARSLQQASGPFFLSYSLLYSCPVVAHSKISIQCGPKYLQNKVTTFLKLTQEVSCPGSHSWQQNWAWGLRLLFLCASLAVIIIQMVLPQPGHYPNLSCLPTCILYDFSASFFPLGIQLGRSFFFFFLSSPTPCLSIHNTDQTRPRLKCICGRFTYPLLYFWCKNTACSKHQEA
jgi:hypothetical protein